MIEVKLEAKPIPIPLAYQPIYKIVLLLAILKYGCSKPHKSAFLKLHIYMWALRSPQNLYVLNSIGNKKRNSIAPWNYEPGLERVVTLSVVNGYCSRVISSGELQIQLTTDGDNLLKKIEEADFFIEEINRVKEVGKISQDRLESANKNWVIK